MLVWWYNSSLFFSYSWSNKLRHRGSIFGVVANVLVCKIIVSEFELQSLYYVFELYSWE